MFLQDKMSIEKCNGGKLEELNATMLHELCQTFNHNITSETLEQSMCAISRSRLRNDFYYCLPRYIDGVQTNLNRKYFGGHLSKRDERLQYFFLYTDTISVNGHWKCLMAMKKG